MFELIIVVRILRNNLDFIGVSNLSYCLSYILNAGSQHWCEVYSIFSIMWPVIVYNQFRASNHLRIYDSYSRYYSLQEAIGLSSPIASRCGSPHRSVKGMSAGVNASITGLLYFVCIEVYLYRRRTMGCRLPNILTTTGKNIPLPGCLMCP